MRYRFLQHTADAKFQAFGKTLEEAFQNAALATASLIYDWKTVEGKLRHHIEIKGKDLKQLLVSFLEELLYLLDSRQFLLNSVEGIHIGKKENHYWLKAQFLGDNHSSKYQTFGDVKAITYNEMRIETHAHFMVQVVVDV